MPDSEETPSFEPPKGWLLFNTILVFGMATMMFLVRTSDWPVWHWIPKTAWRDIDMIAQVGGPLSTAFCLIAMRRISATVQHRLSRIAFVLMNMAGTVIGMSAMVR